MADSTVPHVARLPELRASQLALVPPQPIEYVDGHGIFVKDELNYLSGAGAIGKTTLAMQLGASVALSENAYPGPAMWLGRPVMMRGRVMFVSAEESARTMHLKLMDICADQAITLGDLSNFIIHDISDMDDVALLSSAGRGKPIVKTPLFQAFERSVAKLKPALIIIDNRAQVIAADEIDRGVATKVGNIFRRVAVRNGATLIMLVHPSVSGAKTGRSGSTGWDNSGRNTVLMRKPQEADEDDDEDDGKRQLFLPKANFSKMGVRCNLLWSAGVYVCTDQPPPRAGNDIGRPEKVRRVFLKLLAWHNSNGDFVSTKVRGNYAPRVFGAHRDRENCSIKEFAVAMAELIADQTIRSVQYGPPSDNKWRLEIAKEGV